MNLTHSAAPGILSVFQLCFPWVTLILGETTAEWGVRIPLSWRAGAETALNGRNLLTAPRKDTLRVKKQSGPEK